MNKRIGIILLLSFLTVFAKANAVQVGKEFKVKTDPAQATIYAYNGDLVEIAAIEEFIRGMDISKSPQFELIGEKTHLISTRDYFNYEVFLVAIAAGYEPKTQKFSFNKDLKKEVIEHEIALDTRIFQVNAEPYDAVIYLDGVRMTDSYPCVITIRKNESKSLEIKKDGFSTIKEIFYNLADKPQPPVGIKTYVLNSRMVQLQVGPSTGTSIWLNDTKIGDSDAEIHVPFDECVTILIKLKGYSTREVTYCNKANVKVPPITEKILLVDREVPIRVPEGAIIKINGKEMATKEYVLKLTQGAMAKVQVEKPGFITFSTTLHNSDEEVEPPLFIVLEEGSAEFPEDESYKSSTETDLANQDFIVEIPQRISEKDAWRILAQIVQSYFDELEQIDSETGYLRTAWVYKRYANRTVRTRLIIKINNRKPLKYSLKIQSQENTDTQKLSSRDDDDYKEWTRVLNRYKDIISEAQARLK